MNTFTIDDVLGLNCCDDYDADRIRRLWGDRETATALDVLDSHLPHSDRMWLVFRLEILSDEAINIFRAAIAFFAADIYEKYYPGDSRVSDCAEARRAFSAGEIDDAARDDARDAAWGAAIAAARDAARYAARGAAMAAAMAAARDSARDAARDAARGAAMAAAMAAARDSARDSARYAARGAAMAAAMAAARDSAMAAARDDITRWLRDIIEVYE